MTRYAGILLNKKTLVNAARGTKTLEDVRLYARAAEQLDLPLVFFALSGLDVRRSVVEGLVPGPGGRLVRREVPLPPVVHKRALYGKSKAANHLVEWLLVQGVYLFNQPVDLDKYRMYVLLAENEALRPYLPETVPLLANRFEWFNNQLSTVGEVFVKRCKGSLGLGMARVVRVKQGTYRYETRRGGRTTTLLGAWNLLRRKRSGAYLMQSGIDLARDRGKRYDLRVPIQRGELGKWCVPGMIAKRAGRVPFLTNLARGGKAAEVNGVFARSLPQLGAERLYQEIKELTLLTAQTINDRYPGIVDLGLDVGLDRSGHPYVIEVNRRDLRYSFLKAGERRAFASLYHNPLAYAKHMLDEGLGVDVNLSSTG